MMEMGQDGKERDRGMTLMTRYDEKIDEWPRKIADITGPQQQTGVPRPRLADDETNSRGGVFGDLHRTGSKSGTMISDGLPKVLAGDTGDRCFACGVNRQQRQTVRLVKGGDEVAETFAGAAVTMRLEDHVHATATQARSGNGRAHFGRMMTVVLDYTDAERTTMHGETPANTFAAGEGGELDGGMHQTRGRNRHQCIMHHVCAWNGDVDLAQIVAETDHACATAISAKLQARAVVIARIQPAGNDLTGKTGSDAR